MTIDVTCQCGRVLRAPMTAAGKKGRCKSCGATILVPDPGIPVAVPVDTPLAVVDDDVMDALGIVPDPDEDEEEQDDATGWSARVLKSSTPPRGKPPATPLPPEPWYYWFLVLYAKFIMCAGVFGWSIMVVIGVYYAVTALS